MRRGPPDQRGSAGRTPGQEPASRRRNSRAVRSVPPPTSLPTVYGYQQYRIVLNSYTFIILNIPTPLLPYISFEISRRHQTSLSSTGMAGSLLPRSRNINVDSTNNVNGMPIWWSIQEGNYETLPRYQVPATSGAQTGNVEPLSSLLRQPPSFPHPVFYHQWTAHQQLQQRRLPIFSMIMSQIDQNQLVLDQLLVLYHQFLPDLPSLASLRISLDDPPIPRPQSAAPNDDFFNLGRYELIRRQLNTRTLIREQTSAADQETETCICTICQDELEENVLLATLECGHEYHVDCLKVWLAHINYCPLCKGRGVART